MSFTERHFKKRILVTGGAGFIGSHLVRHFVTKYPDYLIVNVDALTYAGNKHNLDDIKGKPNYVFENYDITDMDAIMKLFKFYYISDVIHLAAESHVDNSIKNPFIFAQTNILGTMTLLQCAMKYWEGKPEFEHRFHHVSTDEVYGALQMDSPMFKETNKYEPHSPYSASKASSDHFVRAYHDTYGLPVTISNCSNNYGPNQFPEKLIPLVIDRIKNNEPIPIYGKGENIRDWLFVQDHIEAIDLIFHNAKVGETYNIGGNTEKTNIQIVTKICEICDKLLGRETPSSELITYVEDRKGHDLRYAIDATKIKTDLGWQPRYTFETALEDTVKWYLDNQEWIDNIKSDEYRG